MSSNDDERPTETQERPNVSTEHQEPGDARRPRDTLDREPERGPAGQPEPSDYDGPVPGGRPPEQVEDRPTVSRTEPDEYPDRAKGSDSGEKD